MAKLSLSEEFDRALQALLAHPGSTPDSQFDARLRPLLLLAGELRHLPRPGFKDRLKSDLQGRTSMTTPAMVSTTIARVPEEYPTAVPYLAVRNAKAAIDFYKSVFGATEISRLADADGKIAHAEIKIGNSLIFLADESLEFGRPSPESLGGSPVRMSMHVENVDAFVEKALAAGAKLLLPVKDTFYGYRSGRIADPFGHVWIVSTRTEEVSASEVQRRLDAMGTQARQPARQEAPGPVRPIPEGFHTITPYLIVPGASRLIDFLAQTFGAAEEVRIPTPDGKIMHARVRIGDAMLELADSNAQYPPLPMPLHVYVADVDSIFHRAVEAGCTVLHPPTDQDYGDHDFAVRDAFGNHWYVGTPLHGAPRPAGLTAVTPYLHPEGTAKFIEFLKDAFGAEELFRAADPAGHVHHAKIQIGDSILEMSDPHEPYGAMPCVLHLYVENMDAVYERAIRAGAASIEAPTDKPYGDRSAGVRDPFGNQWFIATHIRDVQF
jgi:PhnB protein